MQTGDSTHRRAQGGHIASDSSDRHYGYKACQVRKHVPRYVKVRDILGKGQQNACVDNC